MKPHTPTAEDQAFRANVEACALVLDPNVMLRHYLSEVLFSAQARLQFLSPDLNASPA